MQGAGRRGREAAAVHRTLDASPCLNGVDAETRGFSAAAARRRWMPGPVPLHQREDGIRILSPAQTPVVAAERAVEIAVLPVEVIAQYRAAVTQIGAQVEKVVVRVADLPHPERHHLHVTA